MSSDRPKRLRPLGGDAIDRAQHRAPAPCDAELYERLERALAGLPAPERAAAVVAFGLAEGSGGVADELGLSAEDAEALSRSALQLLRGALADVDLDGADGWPELVRRRRRIGNHRPGDELTGG